MSAPDPESLGLAAKIVGVLTAIAAPVVWIHTKLDKKADKAEVELHRKYFADIFNKMDEHQKSDYQQFTKILETMNDHHAEVLREMGRKADR